MIRPVFILCVAAALCPAQTTRVSRPDTAQLPGMLEAELEALGLPIARASSINEIVAFSIEHDAIVASTSIALAQRQVRVLVQGLPGVVRLSHLGPEADAEAAAVNFSVSQRDLTNPKVGEAITTIAQVAGRLTIARDSEAGDSSISSVQFLQDAPAPPGALPDEDPVRLLVNVTRADGTAAVNIKVSASTFAELRRRHTDVVDAYLRPIIRDYGQEGAVFGIPDAIAWQVLGDKYSPEPRVVEQVRAIVARLDADSFRDRVTAANDLRAMGQSAALVLKHMDRSGLSLQQNSGIDSFLAEFAPLGEGQSRSLAKDPSFLLDVLYTQDAFLRRLACEQLSAVAGREIALDDQATAAERSQAIARLRATLRPATQPATQPG